MEPKIYGNRHKVSVALLTGAPPRTKGMAIDDHPPMTVATILYQ